MPLFDKGGIFRLLSLPIFLLLVLYVSGEAAVGIEILNLGIVGTALLLTIPAWFALNLFVAPFRVWMQENQKGTWFGNRFVYGTPQVVFTTLAMSSDNRKQYEISVDDAEPGTLVHFKLEYDGGFAKAQVRPKAVALPDAMTNFNYVSPRTQYEVRLDRNRKAIVAIYSVENSDPTVVRVLMLSWEV